MKIEELEAELKKIRADIQSKKSEARLIERDIANINCPFVIGELLVNKDGCKATVDSITYSSWSEGYEIKVRKLKKNGDPYINSSHAYGFDKWTSVTPITG